MIDTVITSPVPLWRRILGVALVVLVVATVVVFVAGTWNPWRYTVLLEYFRNPALGLAIAVVLGLTASWLLLPVRSEVAQPGRLRLRMTLAGTALVIGSCAGLLQGLSVFAYSGVVVARSPHNDRAVASVLVGGDDKPVLRLWAGSSLATRDVGDLGLECGATSITFPSADLVHVVTSYRDWDIPLDPKSGRPLAKIGPTCVG